MSRAKQLAELGYVAFAADIYGEGVRPADAKEASALAGKYKGDRNLYRERLKAGLLAGCVRTAHFLQLNCKVRAAAPGWAPAEGSGPGRRPPAR